MSNLNMPPCEMSMFFYFLTFIVKIFISCILNITNHVLQIAKTNNDGEPVDLQYSFFKRLLCESELSALAVCPMLIGQMSRERQRERKPLPVYPSQMSDKNQWARCLSGACK